MQRQNQNSVHPTSPTANWLVAKVPYTEIHSFASRSIPFRVQRYPGRTVLSAVSLTVFGGHGFLSLPQEQVLIKCRGCWFLSYCPEGESTQKHVLPISSLCLVKQQPGLMLSSIGYCNSWTLSFRTRLQLVPGIQDTARLGDPLGGAGAGHALPAST